MPGYVRLFSVAGLALMLVLQALSVPAHGGLYRAVAGVRKAVTGAALEEVYKEIDLLREKGPYTEELVNAKTYARGVFVIQNATQNGFVNTLNMVHTNRLADDCPETFQRQISQPSAEMVTRGARCCSDRTTRWS